MFTILLLLRLAQRPLPFTSFFFFNTKKKSLKYKKEIAQLVKVHNHVFEWISDNLRLAKLITPQTEECVFSRTPSARGRLV